ncbi:MAG: HDOD domain-containing protein [Planctomycetota bacterium]|nr:MAG: HDOD domain-containing protein [Planctomycetota bacterium]
MNYVPGGNAAVDAVARRIDEISTLPHVAIRILQIANDPTSCAADLTIAMESDTALSARVLRFVNSSAYGLREKITNLQQAIAYLGVKAIRNLALTASVSELFKVDETIGTYKRSELWRHLVSVAVIARLIARKLGHTNAEDMFLAGLLHDIGIILEDQHIHTSFCRVIDRLTDETPLCAVEKNVLAFDHSMLGECLGKLWGFPEGVKDTIRYHHMSVNYRGKHADVVRCVELANALCSNKGITSVGRNLTVLSKQLLQSLRITPPLLRDIMTLFDEELEDHKHLIALA